MDLARNLLDWHGGQSSPTYQVGSHLYGGHPVKREWVDNALLELKETLIRIGHIPSYSEADRDDLDKLIIELTKYRDAMPKE